MASRARRMLLLAIKADTKLDNQAELVAEIENEIEERDSHLDNEEEAVMDHDQKENSPEVMESEDVGEHQKTQSKYCFSDFGSDDSVADKNYEPTSSEGSSADLAGTDPGTDNFSETEEDDDNVNASVDDDNYTFPDENDWEDIVSSDQLPCTQQPEEAVLNINGPIFKPLDAYKLFLTDEILDMIVLETNRYALQCLSDVTASKSRLKVWVDTTKEEVKRFFAIVLVMGLVQEPALNLYWSKDSMFRNEFIATTMTRDRFLVLLRCLHFCDNTNERLTEGNRLYKLKNLLDMLNRNFQSVLSPGRAVVIDESLIPFRGRLLFKQYIPNKSHKYGIKLYKLCTVDGYTHNIIIYTGKNEKKIGKSHSESIVFDLLASLNALDGHMLYADNFYSSLPLAKSLFDQKMLYCGTLRTNRKGIPKIFNKKMKKGEIFGKQYDCLKIIKWVDKRPVLMLSTDPKHEACLTATGKKSRNEEDIMKPKAVIDYNKAKKGVDYSDQMSSYHSVLRKGLKWYRKLACELLFGTAVVNAWIIYNKLCTPKMSITEFRKVLAKQLVEPEIANEAPNNQPPRRSVHKLMKPTGPGRKKRKMCIGCYRKLRRTMDSRTANKKVTKVISYCNDCTKKPGMCLDCFNNLHRN